MSEMDEDEQEAVNALGKALSAFAVGHGSKSDVLAVMEGIDALILIRITQMTKLMADRVEAKMADARAALKDWHPIDIRDR
jgi:hypothetical protein